MDNAQNLYNSYQTYVQQTLESMNSLSRLCRKLDLQKTADSLNSAKEKLQDSSFLVGIMGEFRRGKSTVINALLGRQIVPSDIVPTSATINYVRWGASPSAEINFKDGTVKRISVDELDGYITKITDESAAVASTVKNSVVYYPCPLCQNDVQIVDTPGVNDEDSMTQVAEEVIPYLDAVVMVITVDSPLSQSEADFVRTKIMTSNLGQLLFVVNKLDNLEPEDRPRFLENVKLRTKQKILKGIADSVGQDSSQYHAYQDMLPEIRVIGVSAREALRGKRSGDQRKIEESNFGEFESALSHILTEQRGLVKLISPVNTTLSSAKEVERMIEVRLSALDMDKDKLAEIAKESEKVAQKSRAMAENRIEDMKKRAGSLYTDLLNDVEHIYQTVEEGLLQYVDDVTIDPAQVATEGDADKKALEIATQIDKELESRISAGAETLAVKVQQKINDEIIQITRESNEIFGGLAKVESSFHNLHDSVAFDWGVAAIDAVTNVMCLAGGGIFGIGGVLTGFKENGIPGALVGGATGYAAGYAAFYAAAAILGAPAVIPALAIGGVVSAFSGKVVVRALFKKKTGERNIAKIRAALKETVQSSMKNVRDNRVLEHWLRTTSDGAYAFVAEKLRQEMEAVLTDFETTISDARLERLKGEADIQKARDNLNDMRLTLNDIEKKITPVRQKLAGVLRKLDTDAEPSNA